MTSSHSPHEPEAGADINDQDSCTTASDMEYSDPNFRPEAALAKGILAEGKIAGETRYLVEWDGRPISRATLVPRRHVEGLCLETWEDTKKLQKQGKADKFELSDWKEAWIQERQAIHEKHTKRNKIRDKLRKPISIWDSTLGNDIEKYNGYFSRFEQENDEISDEKDLRWSESDETSAKTPVNKSQSPAGPTPPPEVVLPETRSETRQQPATETIVVELRPRGSKVAEASGTNAKEAVAISNKEPAPTPKATTQRLRGNGVRQMLAGSKPVKRKAAAAKPSGAAKASPSKPSGGASAARDRTGTSNVFIGGKKVKPRPKLREAASDSSRKPTILKLRYQNKLTHQRRDREDAEPVQAPKNFFSLDPGQRTPGGTEGTNPGVPSSTRSDPSSSADETVPMDAYTDTEAPPNPKRKRSVRINDEVSYQEPDFEPMVMSREPELFLQAQDDGSRSARRAPDQPDSQQTSTATQDFTKRCLIGSNAHPISLVFKKLQQSGQPWLSHFRSCDQVVFSHICTAQDFLKDWKVGTDVRQCDLASGYMSCPTESIEHVVDRLKLNAQGILSCSEEYSILCFPNKCDEWNLELNNDASDEGSPLRFIIFQRAGDVSPFFAPNPQRTVRAVNDPRNPLIPRGLDKFLDRDYSRLIPMAMQNSKEHRFFFAIPVVNAYADEMRFMARWLTSTSTATCRIFSGETPGAWHEFVHRGLSSEGGIIILHEDAVWQVRLFPKMFETIQSAKFSFWVFTRGLEENRLFPSSYETPSKPALLGLERVFSSGSKAFLLTPSFILSEPRALAAFMKWFRGKYVARDDVGKRGRLVVCTGFANWLLDLVCDQSRNKHRRLSKSDTDAWCDALRDFYDLESRKAYLIVAPDGIDGDDEQSLVNWFGFWTLKHMDEICLGYVIGSNANRVEEMTKRIDHVGFVKDAQEDPNAAEDQASKELEEQASQRHRSEDCEMIQYFMNRFSRSAASPSPVSVFNQPVSYWNDDIGPALGDRDYKFAMYGKWQRFAASGLRSKKNTFGGLFYTIEADWLGKALSPPEKKRRPWVAFIRPRNPHWRQYTNGLELLIWDPSYRTKFNNWEEIPEEALIDAQRQLIKLVSAQRMSGLRLETVRLGWDNVASPNSRDWLPMAQCIEMIEDCEREPWDLVPAPEFKLAQKGWVKVIPHKLDGQKPKDEDEETRSQGSAKMEASPGLMDIDMAPGELPGQNDEDDASNLRVVFHPPRSPWRRPGPSNCRNRFLGRLRQAEHRKQDRYGEHRKDEDIYYTFAPTMNWYDDQIKEGRDFKHLMVASHTKVFRQLRVPPP